MATNKKTGGHGFCGVPPPPTFSLADLPDDALLTDTDIAACLRVAKSTTAGWRQDPKHLLEWIVLPGGFVRSTLAQSENTSLLACAGEEKPHDDAANA